jgi:transketolase
MAVKIYEPHDPIATRYAYAEAIVRLGEEFPNIVVLDADVSTSIKTTRFRDRFPERSFNFGIAEQNMFCAAAGMATCGLIPFVSTYAVFATMRALEQVRTTICYPCLNVKIAASHGGITPAPDGVSHQGQEDIGLMRTLPNMVIIVPTDRTVVPKALRAAIERVGPVYLRFTREPVPTLYDETFPFEIGKGVQIREGNDATIIATGDLVWHALEAARELAGENIAVRVIDMPTIKPLDEAIVVQAAKETGAIITAENHVMFGGLGSAVAEVLVENYPVPMQRVAIRDTFAESGAYPELLDKYGLSAPHIAAAVRKVLRRKKSPRKR